MSDQYNQQSVATAAENWGELPSLTRRIERFQKRLKNGQAPLGLQPGRDAIELSSNDYLCLGGHSAIIESQVAVLEGGGNDVYMSAAFLTDATMQRSVERKMAAFLGTEDAVLCQSGWCANLGLMQAITDRGTMVYLDLGVHAAIWDGARSTGAKISSFRQNSPESLKHEIEKYGAGVIVVSTVCGTTGAVCPLEEITDIADRYGCEVVADETHSIGVYGRKGEGLVSALGLQEKVNYRSFSLAKATVTRAGMVTGPARIMDFFRYESRPAIFSSAVLPHEVAGLSAALNIIQEDDWRRESLRRNSATVRQRLVELGFDVPLEGSQIIPLVAGPEEAAFLLRDVLEKHGLFGTLISSSVTPENECLVRLSINSGLIDDDLIRITDICARVRDEIPKDQWPVTLQKGKGANSASRSEHRPGNLGQPSDRRGQMSDRRRDKTSSPKVGERRSRR